VEGWGVGAGGSNSQRGMIWICTAHPDHPAPSDAPSTNARHDRVGRTARYLATGRAIMLLLPSEKEGMVAALEEAKVPIKLLKHNPAKLQPVGPALQVRAGWLGCGLSS